MKFKLEITYKLQLLIIYVKVGFGIIAAPKPRIMPKSVDKADKGKCMIL